MPILDDQVSFHQQLMASWILEFSMYLIQAGISISKVQDILSVDRWHFELEDVT